MVSVKDIIVGSATVGLGATLGLISIFLLWAGALIILSAVWTVLLFFQQHIGITGLYTFTNLINDAKGFLLFTMFWSLDTFVGLASLFLNPILGSIAGSGNWLIGAVNSVTGLSFPAIVYHNIDTSTWLSTLSTIQTNIQQLLFPSNV